MEIKKRDQKNTVEACHLRNMGLASTMDINRWFQDSYSGQYWLKGIEEAIRLMLAYISKTVYVFGDYDVDGIMATAIMVRALRWYGFKNVKYRIPHRFSEGYGLNKTMIDEIAEPAGEVLIVTVDNGIAAHEAVSYAKNKGFTIIVTDHHLPVMENGEVKLPDADIIIDPQAVPDTAKFKGYCGAGIAYAIAQKLFEQADATLQIRCMIGLKALQVCVMLATFCDQMQLTEENYVFARNGLEKVRKGLCLPGITALTEVLGVQFWEADTALFHAGPSINALERMTDGAAQIGVELMLCDNIDDAREIAVKLKDANDQRKAAVESAKTKIFASIDAMDDPGYPLIVYEPGVSMGLIGIIAGQIADKYKIPTAVFSDDSDDVLKGSFRAPEGYDVKAHLDMCADTLIQFGGHAQAAGASVKKDGFEAFRKAMQDVSVAPSSATDAPLFYDLEIEAKDIAKAIEENEKFAPFGNGNEDLVFKITNFEVIPQYNEYRSLMKGNSVKIASQHCKAVGFGMWDKTEEVDGPCTLTIYGYIGNNHYNGYVTPTIRMIDLEVKKKQSNLSPIAGHLNQMAKSR